MGLQLVCGRPTLALSSALFLRHLEINVRYFEPEIHASMNHPILSLSPRVWSGGAMVLGKLPVPGRPTILITVGQGPIALAVGAGGGGLDIFTLLYLFFLPLLGRHGPI